MIGALVCSYPIFLLLTEKLSSSPLPAVAQASLPSEGVVSISTPTFISLLTLSVAIIAGIVTLVNIVVALLSVKYAKSAKTASEDIQDVREKAHELSSKLMEELNGYRSVMQEGVSALHPANSFMSGEVKRIADELSGTECECAQTIKRVLAKLSLAFLSKAEFADKIQRLYLGKKDEVAASIFYLVQNPGVHSLSLLRARLEFEKRLKKPNPELLDQLTRAVVDLERTLH